MKNKEWIEKELEEAKKEQDRVINDYELNPSKFLIGYIRALERVLDA